MIIVHQVLSVLFLNIMIKLHFCINGMYIILSLVQAEYSVFELEQIPL